MKNSIENITNRQKKILQQLTEYHEMSVQQLSSILDVSEATIRRDLTLMEDKGQLKRIHGGCKLHDKALTSDEAPEITRIRHALAKKAVSFIKNDDVLFLNSSRTALLSMHYLNNLRTTIFTNNVHSIYLKPDDNTTLILSGGEIRFPKEAMVGDNAIHTISNVTGDICIMGCNGIHPIYGVTTDSLHEAKVNSLFFENTVGPRIVLADYRKVGVRSSFKSMDTVNIDILITDIYAPKNVLHSLEKQGIKVIQIDPLSESGLVLDKCYDIEL